MTATLPPLPTFLIIGAQKSATRWLRSHLGEHPDIFTSDAEISYFNHDVRYGLGPDWYRSQFEGWDGEAFVGESTPGYLMWRHEPAVVAQRMAETVPDVRLIAMLRDPVERALSAVVHHRRHERVRPSATVAELVAAQPAESDRLGIVAGGWYVESLTPFLDRFGDQLLVLLHDDVRDHPADTFAKAVHHVGAAPGHLPDDLATVRFSNRGPDTGAATESDDRLEADRAVLAPVYAAEVDRLERLLGRDLSAWRHV